MRHLLAVSLLVLSAPAFGQEANILELQLEIQRLLNEQPVEVVSNESANRDTFARPVEAIDTSVTKGTATQEAEPRPYVRQPHLIATVADRGCGPCERWEAETLPALIEAGWEVQVNRVPFGSEVTPSFVFGKKTRRDYGGRKDFMAWLSPATVSLPPGPPVGVTSQPVASAGFRYVNGKLVDSDGAVVTQIDGKAVAEAKPAPVRQVRTAGWHTHTCDRCGNSWSHGREANGNRAMHTCANCGAEEWN